MTIVVFLRKRTTMNFSITDEIKKNQQIYSVGNKDWCIFIKDHIRNILANSSKQFLHPNDLQKYRYRPTALFDIYGKIEPADVWIVMMLNNIPISTGIPIYTTEVFIPSAAHIDRLKEQYAAHSAMVSKLNKLN